MFYHQLTRTCNLMSRLVTALFKEKRQTMSSQTNGYQNGTTTKIAVLGMGCFWAPDSIFGSTIGVLRTKVGYSGGKSPNPAYRNLGDHTEVIQVDYNPSIISFEDILKIFWKNHDPTSRHKVQYRSMILYTDEEDKQIAEKSKEEESKLHPTPMQTLIVPFERFYDAEDYHQKYRLKGHTWLVEKLFSNNEEYKTSTLAAKLNGYLVGAGGIKQFEQEVDSLGLPDDVKAYVHRYVVSNEGHGLSCGI